MPITTRQFGDAIVLAASGRITIGHGDVLIRDAVARAVASGYRKIIIDLEDVKTLDSSGTGELLAAHHELERLDGRLVLTRLSPRVGGVLMSTRLSGVLEIYDSLEGALVDVAA